METKEKKLFGLSSWVLALLTAFLSLTFLFFFVDLLGSILKIDKDISEIFAYILSGIIIAAACYFICRHNPKSVWYVPIIANIPGIISAIVEPIFWITYLWILICGGWVLSVIAAIIGAKLGQGSSLKPKMN
ncbi:MAG TPA: hypothetical protein VMZ49_05065 [Patescibacteria group bacterium]|nr:hypothetical protein [Patescibacteria group bacterium]